MWNQRLLSLLLTAIPIVLVAGCVSGTARQASPITENPDTAMTPGEDAAVIEPDVPIGPPGIDGGGEPVVAVDGGASLEAGSPVGIDGGTSVPDTAVAVPDTAPSWWPAPFKAGSLPDPSNGRGNHAGSSPCLSCHKSGGAASSAVWLMGGIVYSDTTSTTAVPSAEIGIKDGDQFWSTYSATNGYFWLPSSAGTINWSSADIRIRTVKGELAMHSRATSGDCQTCHSSGNRIHPTP